MDSLYTLSCETTSEIFRLKAELVVVKNETSHENTAVTQLVMELQNVRSQRFRDGFHHWQVVGSRTHPEFDFGQIPLDDDQAQWLFP